MRKSGGILLLTFIIATSFRTHGWTNSGGKMNLKITFAESTVIEIYSPLRGFTIVDHKLTRIDSVRYSKADSEFCIFDPLRDNRREEIKTWFQKAKPQLINVFLKPGSYEILNIRLNQQLENGSFTVFDTMLNFSLKRIHQIRKTRSTDPFLDTVSPPIHYRVMCKMNVKNQDESDVEQIYFTENINRILKIKNKKDLPDSTDLSTDRTTPKF